MQLYHMIVATMMPDRRKSRRIIVKARVMYPWKLYEYTTPHMTAET